MTLQICHKTNRKWNAKEWDKTTKIEILIFSHSLVDGLVYALCSLSTRLEAVLRIEVHYVVRWMFQADISHLILLPLSSREQFALVLSLTFTVRLWSCSGNFLVAKLYLEWMVIKDNNDWGCVILDKGRTWSEELNQTNCGIFNWFFFLIILFKFSFSNIKLMLLRRIWITCKDLYIYRH